MSKIFVHDLMTISKVLILIIGQNNTNPKLLQPIVTSICKVMAVKKPSVLWTGGRFFLKPPTSKVLNFVAF